MEINLNNIDSIFFNGTHLNELKVDNEIVWDLVTVTSRTEAYDSVNSAKDRLKFEDAILEKTLIDYEEDGVFKLGFVWSASQSGITYYMGRHMDVWFRDPLYAMTATSFTKQCYTKWVESVGIRRIYDDKKWTSVDRTHTRDVGTWGCRVENRVINIYRQSTWKWV